MKNFVIDYFKEAGFKGFAHILEDNVIFFKDPSKYLTTIEKTMSFLDYDIHFSTVTDPCNYIFSKFNPRITLDIDNQTLLDLGLTSAISFTSHSNAAYIIYNFNAFVNTEIPKFNESFSVAMYMIIEFLARRKAQKRKDQLYYMN
jgi:GR25 family glycosyltransferase involved in LPS biosynthesis